MDGILSPCHKASLFGSLTEGIETGSCRICNEDIVRRNPHTGLLEWLDGNPPWTTEALYPLPVKFQNLDQVARLLTFLLTSPCHNLPIRYVKYGDIEVGICSKCNSIFARINPATGRVEIVEDEMKIDFGDVGLELPEFPEEFQPIQY